MCRQLMREWWVAALAFVSMSALAACGGGGGEDACANVLCSGYGACLVVDGAPVCSCNSGYTADGLACKPNQCNTSDCLHGHCEAPASSTACVCDDGYSGTHCDACAFGYYLDNLQCVKSTACADAPCKHGTCTPVNETVFTCACDSGYAGDTCSDCASGYTLVGDHCVTSSVCDPNPCGHGTCSEVSGTARCACAEGYAGDLCDQCAQGYVASGLLCKPQDVTNPCTPNPCTTEHRTVCTNDNGRAVCSCDAGWHDDNGTCAVDMTCVPATTCAGHGTCTGSGLACTCDTGYEGDHCDACTDGYSWHDSECAEDSASDPCTPNPCTEPHRGACTAKANGLYTCACDTGYTEDNASGLCLVTCTGSACADAANSFHSLVSANGFGALVADLTTHKLVTLLEHPYTTWGPNESNQIAVSRDMLYDSYFGVRLRTTNSGYWLNDVPIDNAEYYGESGILHFVQHVITWRIDTYAYAPWELNRPAVVMVARVTNMGTSTQGIDLYSIHNYHVGYTDGATDSEPDADSERISGAADDPTYTEVGPGGAFVHHAFEAVDHKGAAGAATSDNPYVRLQNGQDLADNLDTGVGADRSAGFEKQFMLGPGESGYLGVVSAFDRSNGDTAIQALKSEIASAYGTMTAKQVLAGALSSWESWRTTPPVGLTPAESLAYRTSEAVVRMGQVWETTDRSKGQILASLPPGIWSIAWARDMSYSIVALARSGHKAEAKAALEFMLGATSNTYASYVGHDYQISVCRYYGKGREESDSNADGPNIEFDGFGLFLWAMQEYVSASGDTAFVDANWAVIRDKIAGVLVALTASNGMIGADSSIWETHWNGKQKQYTYTSLAAIQGLCSAATVGASGHTGDATAWRNGAASILAGIKAHAVSGGSTLAQSVEELSAGSGYTDAAVVEAFNWMLFDPKGTVSSATLGGFETGLLASPLNHGYFRNDDGGEYDSKEWLFIDLRIAMTRLLRGDTAQADAILDWVTAQSLSNYGLIPELYTRTKPANYDGAIPMVGFGAGSYMLDMWLRANPVTPAAPCGLTW